MTAMRTASEFRSKTASRPASNGRKSPAPATSSARKLAQAAALPPNPMAQASRNAKEEPVILFQKYFKSVGPRTYAAQIKEMRNGNQLLVLTEGKRDPETGAVRKTKLFIYGEDLSAYFRMLHETVSYLRANPLSEDFLRRRDRFWARKARGENGSPAPDARRINGDKSSRAPSR